MLKEIQTLHKVWLSNRTVASTAAHQMSFDDLTNSIISTGPFSFYIIDFSDLSLSHASSSLFEMHSFHPETVTLNDILNSVHPEDIDFVVKAEDFLGNLFYKKLGYEKLLNYKISYNFRFRMKNGDYVLFNHQSLMLTLHDNGGLGKSLNIHTRIDHLSTTNTYKISLIGLNGEPSLLNLSLDNSHKEYIEFSKREIDIIKLIGDGLNNTEIADRLFISPLTVKKHRTNILKKSDAKNTAQLIKKCILEGLI